MIPESRRGTWVSEDFIDSDSDDDVRRYLHASWKRRTREKKTESKEYTRLKKKGLTKLQAYVAAYNK